MVTTHSLLHTADRNYAIKYSSIIFFKLFKEPVSLPLKLISFEQSTVALMLSRTYLLPRTQICNGIWSSVLHVYHTDAACSFQWLSTPNAVNEFGNISTQTAPLPTSISDNELLATYRASFFQACNWRPIFFSLQIFNKKIHSNTKTKELLQFPDSLWLKVGFCRLRCTWALTVHISFGNNTAHGWKRSAMHKYTVHCIQVN